MKGKILGGYSFKNKKGNLMCNITVENDRPDVIGVSASSYMAMRSNMPCDLKDMLNKTYIIDKDDIGFLSAFYEVK